MCCYIFDQISCVDKVQCRLRLKCLVTEVVGSGSLWRLWSLTMLQVGCRGCLVDVWVLYFPKNNFLPLAFKLSTKSHGICVQWRSIERLDMWKSLLWANRKLCLDKVPPLSLLTWSIFHLSVYYLATVSNSADKKHTTTHHPAFSFIYNVKACTYVSVKFLWKFENLNHLEDDLQLHTLHFTRQKFPLQQTASKQQQRTLKRVFMKHSSRTEISHHAQPFLRAHIFFLYHAIMKKNWSPYLSCPPETLLLCALSCV